VCFGDVVRTGRTQGAFVEVDCDEDGRFDGWTRLTNLAAAFDKRPDWVSDRAKRRAIRRGATHCRQPGD
jgi:hypothetical protein